MSAWPGYQLVELTWLVDGRKLSVLSAGLVEPASLQVQSHVSRVMERSGVVDLRGAEERSGVKDLSRVVDLSGVEDLRVVVDLSGVVDLSRVVGLLHIEHCSKLRLDRQQTGTLQV